MVHSTFKITLASVLCFALVAHGTILDLNTVVRLLLSPSQNCATINRHLRQFNYSGAKLKDGAFVSKFQPVWAKDDAPYGDQTPTITVSLNLTATTEELPSVQVVVYPDTSQGSLGALPTATDERIFLCCSAALKNQGRCESASENQVITRPGPGVEVSAVLPVKLNEASAWTYQLVVPSSHKWGVLILNCKAESSVQVNGTVAWFNAYGWVKAGYFRLLPFYLVMAILNILLGLIFFGLCVYYRRDILRVQLGIAGVFLLGMMESFTWYAFYRITNETGYYPDGTTFFGIVFTVAKATVSRALVLFVCMGLGVTKLSVGSTKYKIFLLAIIFAIVTCIFEVDMVKRETDRDSTKTDTLFNFVILTAVALTNVMFLWWTFVSLVRTTHQLSLRKQDEKLLLFKRLLYVMIGATIAFVAGMLFLVFLKFVVQQSDEWKRQWIWDVIAELAFFVILLIVAWLWRPNANNTRYGMSELVDSSDDTTVQLQPLGGELTQRSDTPQTNQYDNDREKNIKETTGTATTSGAELQMIENLASFTLNEEDEEDEVALAKGKLD